MMQQTKQPTAEVFADSVYFTVVSRTPTIIIKVIIMLANCIQIDEIAT